MSRKQEAVVVAVLPCGQIVVDACHHNADIREGGAGVGLRHIATYPYVNLQEDIIMLNEEIWYNWSLILSKGSVNSDAAAGRGEAEDRGLEPKLLWAESQTPEPLNY